MTYERKFGRYLHRLARRLVPEFTLSSGQWIEYEDANGPGNAQPDHILRTPTTLFIFENKLTLKEEGWFQLIDLYSPLCSHLWNLRQVLVLVCKNLGEITTHEGYDVRQRLSEILKVGARTDIGDSPRFLLHWLGVMQGG